LPVYLFSAFGHPADYPQQLSLVLTVMGVVLMACGWPMARWSWFAVAFLIFAVPLPKALYVPDDHAPAFHRRQRLVGAAQFDSPHGIPAARGAGRVHVPGPGRARSTSSRRAAAFA